MVWRKNGPDGNESAKIRWEIVPYTRGRVLDLGCGENKAFPHFIGVDNCHHSRFGYQIKPDLFVQTCERLDLIASQSCDAVFSSHLLEHIEDYKAALKEWWRVVKIGGYLVLYLPHKDFYPNIGQDGANPDHKHDFLPDDVIGAMPQGWELVERQERNGGDEYSMLLVFRKLSGSKNVHSWDRPKPDKTAIVVRYGAFGDLMQASSVFAGLKKQGYHVTLHTSPPGCEVITSDPNIDRLVLQDKDQVPNHNLGEFWADLASKCDRFVNLSESVEGTFLALPGRTAHAWPHEIRHKMLNQNYLQFQHELAGVPHVPAVKFFPTLTEKEWARKQRSKLGDRVIVWSLAGSSVHKTWPHLDTILARLMLTYPDTHVVLMGGADCVILEQGWEQEPRIHKTSGKWEIRQSLAFLEHADLVIGPETGVLNAACCMPVPKIVTLSHSSVENLTRDWVNTTSLFPKETPCFPCHQLHYGWKHCVRNDNGTAQCQTDISAEDMWAAVRTQMDKRKAA